MAKTTATDTRLGFMHYLAVEQLKPNPANPRNHFFALGIRADLMG